VLLPDRGASTDDLGGNPKTSSYCTEVRIPPESELVGSSLLNSRLQRRFDVDVLELQRGGERLLPPLADRRLEAGDHLLLRVTRLDLLRLQQDHTVQLTTQGQNAGFSLNTEEASGQKTVEVLLPAGSTLAGASLRELRFRQRHNATVLALRRGQETVQERLGQVILREGDVLLLQAPIDSIRGLQASNDLLVLDRLEDDLPTVRRKPVAVSIALAMLLLPTLTPIPLVAAVMFIGTTLLTQVMSNAASVALLAPVAVQLAPSLQLSPTALLITVLFGASQSFLTPVGYQTNLMVFGPGRYRFLDVTRYGLGLTVIMTILVPALILWHYGGS
jgi:di/tricarboxylate transporter